MTRDPIRKAARRLGRGCRRVIDGLLYRWEVRDCDEEFERIIYEGICELLAASDGGDRGETDQPFVIDRVRSD